MTRITTPFDDFIDDVATWLNQPWYVWASVVAVIATVAATTLIVKARNRAHARVPHYKRQQQGQR